MLWAKEILKSDLLALTWFKWASWLVQTDWQRCLHRCFVLFLAVYTASPLSSHMMTLKEPASILQDLERMNLLLCSKCFIWRIWKEIQERDDKFCVAPLQSCKELCGEKSNLQSYNMRTWNNMSKEVEPSGSGQSHLIRRNVQTEGVSVGQHLNHNVQAFKDHLVLLQYHPVPHWLQFYSPCQSKLIYLFQSQNKSPP